MVRSKETQVIELIERSARVGLVTHVDGDGDGFGSMLALKRIIETMGRKVVIFSAEPLLPIFDFLANEICYQPKREYEPVDLLIGLDGNFFERFSVPDLFEKAIENGAKTTIIDHHIPSDVGEKVDLYWGDSELSSASEMVYRITKKLRLKVDKTTATLLLMGIETDTNSLQFENSKPEVYLAIADLLNQGARLKSVMESAFSGKPLPMIQLLGRVLERLKITKVGLAVSYVTLKDKEELGLVDKVSSGVANFLEQAEESKISIVFEEVGGGEIKVSMRSNNSNVDVAKFANYFGGGGHRRAAAFKFKGSLKDLIPGSK